MIVCSGGTTDDGPRSIGSVICSDTSAGASCVWGSDEEEKMLLGSGKLDEVEKMVLSSVALAGSWCSLGLFS